MSADFAVTSRGLRWRRGLRTWQVVVLDAVLLTASAVASFAIRAEIPVAGHDIYPVTVYVPFFAVLVASWLLFMFAFGMYGGRMDQPANFIRTLIKINYNFVIFVAVVAFVLRLTTTNRILFVLFLLLSNVVVAFTHGRASFERSKSFTIVGTDSLVCSAFSSSKEYFALQNANFAGYLLPSVQYDHFFTDNDLPVLGTMEHTIALLPKQVDCVVVALPSDFPAREHLVEDLQETGLRVLLACKVPERIEFVPI